MKIPKGYKSESINQRRTDNTMTKRTNNDPASLKSERLFISGVCGESSIISDVLRIDILIDVNYDYYFSCVLTVERIR